MKKKFNEEEREVMRYGMSHAGMFGIIYNSMVKENKEPFAKDIDEYFSKIEIMRNAICKNPIADKLHKDFFNLGKDE